MLKGIPKLFHDGIGKNIPKAILLLFPSSLRTMQLSTSLASQTRRNENRCCVVEQKKQANQNETKTFSIFILRYVATRCVAESFIHMILGLFDVTFRATTNRWPALALHRAYPALLSDTAINVCDWSTSEP
jgi:hypothetical protein